MSDRVNALRRRFLGPTALARKCLRASRTPFGFSAWQVGLRASYEGIKTDFTQDLKRIDVPTVIIHGEDDQNVPIAATALMSSKLIKNATLKVYPGAPHGLTVTHKDQFNDDLLIFVKGLR